MKYLIFILKILFSVFCVYLSIRKVDLIGLKELIGTNNGLFLMGAAISVTLLQTTLAGMRLKPIVELFEHKITSFRGIQLWFLGNFFSQFLISFIGGDTIRIIALSKSGMRSGVAFRAIFLDRVFGFIALQILFLMSLPLLIQLVKDGPMYWGILTLTGVSIAMILGFFVMGLLPFKSSRSWLITRMLDIGSISRYLYRSKSHTIRILGFCILVHFCSIYLIYFLTNSLGGNLLFSQAFWIGSIVLLLSILPISISGWGVRESAMIMAFGLINISSNIALMVSVICGLALLISSLPGAIVMLGKAKDVGIEAA